MRKFKVKMFLIIVICFIAVLLLANTIFRIINSTSIGNGTYYGMSFLEMCIFKGIPENKHSTDSPPEITCDFNEKIFDCNAYSSYKFYNSIIGSNLTGFNITIVTENQEKSDEVYNLVLNSLLEEYENKEGFYHREKDGNVEIGINYGTGINLTLQRDGWDVKIASENLEYTPPVEYVLSLIGIYV